MSPVQVLASAALPVTRDGTRSPRAMGREVGRSILDATGIEPDALVVGNMLSGILSHQQQLGALLANDLGLAGVEAWTTEAACGSGAVAVLGAARLLLSGEARAVLVIGVEAMTHVETAVATAGLATAAERETESSQGETFVSLNATLMEHYLKRYALDEDALMPFSLLAHRNALDNPLACLHKRVTEEDYLRSRILHGPLRLFDASPTCDGAAALLLTTADVAASRADLHALTLRGYAIRTDALSLAGRDDMLALRAAGASFGAALARAELERDRIDLFELHDAYTVMAALALESCGFSAPGQAAYDAAEGRFDREGALPIATFGGLKSRGHPVGATGVYQVHELCLQLTGHAGAAQVRGARIGASQNVGGTGSTVATLILEGAS